MECLQGSIGSGVSVQVSGIPSLYRLVEIGRSVLGPRRGLRKFEWSLLRVCRFFRRLGLGVQINKKRRDLDRGRGSKGPGSRVRKSENQTRPTGKRHGRRDVECRVSVVLTSPS